MITNKNPAGGTGLRGDTKSSSDSQNYTKDVEKFFRLIAKPDGVVELRILKVDGHKRHIDAGYFNEPEKFAAAALKYDRRAPGVYMTLNPVKPALLARFANRIEPWAEQTTADHDIERRRWFIVDLDPARPSGISATDGELQCAKNKAEEIARTLADRGWPDPIVAVSGNGCYLLYRIDLPNDDESRDLIKACLEALASEFDDEHVDVDQTMFNASRIIKVIGTHACKGDSTVDRPHRQSHLVQVPGHG